VKVLSPKTIDDALAALTEATDGTRLLAGGTDLMVEFDIGRTRPSDVINLWQLDELRGIEVEPDGLRLGALVTCSDLLDSKLVRERADLLSGASAEFGATQIRNRATIGGNLGTASPAADLNPALLALGAIVRLRSTRGPRDVPARDFIAGYRTNLRERDELIDSVLIPNRPDGERRGFRKVGTRRAQSISKVVVAVALVPDGDRLRSATAAAGSVSDRTLCLPSIERDLVGPSLSRQLIDKAARTAADDDVTPRSDVRSTAEYRTETLYRVLRRLLLELTVDA
jgi:CO/xanthine dehydrogenase FAD-binding subunit